MDVRWRCAMDSDSGVFGCEAVIYEAMMHRINLDIAGTRRASGSRIPWNEHPDPLNDEVGKGGYRVYPVRKLEECIYILEYLKILVGGNIYL